MAINLSEISVDGASPGQVVVINNDGTGLTYKNYNENAERVNLYLPLSSKFVSVDHLYIKGINGNVTNFNPNLTYIINAVNTDGRMANYYGDENTLSISGGNVFYITSLEDRLAAGPGIHLTHATENGATVTTISAGATWNTEYITDEPNNGIQDGTIYVCQNPNGMILNLPSDPTDNERVGFFVLKLLSPNIVRIVPSDSTPIYVGVTNVMDDNDPGLDIEAPLVYAELVYKAEEPDAGWHVVELITPSSQREYKAGEGLTLEGTNTFKITPGAAGTVLKSNGNSVYWGEVQGGGFDGNYKYQNTDGSLSFPETQVDGWNTISVNADWLSGVNEGGYNAIYSAISSMIGQNNTSNAYTKFGVLKDPSNKKIKILNPIPDPPSNTGTWVLVFQEGVFKWIEAGICQTSSNNGN